MPTDSRRVVHPGEFVVSVEASRRVGVRELKKINGQSEVWTYELLDAEVSHVRALVGSEFPTRLVIDGVAWAPHMIDEKAKHVTYSPEQ